jgi:hypothetical protein
MTSGAQAEDAIYEAIVNLANSAKEYGGATEGAMVRDAAIAYRAVRGGQQPGSVVVETK